MIYLYFCLRFPDTPIFFKPSTPAAPKFNPLIISTFLSGRSAFPSVPNNQTLLLPVDIRFCYSPPHVLICFSSGDVLILSTPLSPGSPTPDLNSDLVAPDPDSSLDQFFGRSFIPILYLPLLFLHRMRVAASVGVPEWLANSNESSLSREYRQSLLS